MGASSLSNSDGSGTALSSRSEDEGNADSPLARIARLAATTLRLPAAMVAFCAGNTMGRQVSFGLPSHHSEDHCAFCMAAKEVPELFQVPDTLADPRFRDLELVREAPRLRFCAGRQMRAPDGTALAVLVVFDTQPRQLSPEEAMTLADLAALGAEALSLTESLYETARTQTALAQSEAQQRAVLETAVDAILTIDSQGRILSTNDAVTRLTGYAQEELLGQNVSLLAPEPHASQHDAYLARYLETRKPHIIGIGREVAVQRKDGSTFPAELSVSAFQQGRTLCFAGILRDISARVEVENALKRERDLLRGIFTAAATAIIVLDRDGQIRYANRRAEEIFGLTEDQTTARSHNDPAWRITGPEGEPFPEQDLPFSRVMATGEAVFDVVHAIERPDGQRRILSINGAPLKGADGQVSDVVFSVADTTEAYLASRALRCSEERLQLAQSFGRIGIWEWKQAEDVIHWSRQVPFLFGLAQDEAAGSEMATSFERFIQIVHPEDREQVSTAFRRCLAPDQELDIEHRVVWPDGSVRWLQLRGNIVRDKGGQPQQMLGVVSDISERRSYQDALARFRRIVETSIQAIGVASLDGRIVYVNPAHERLFEGTAEAILGHHFGEFMPDSAEEERQYLSKLLGTGQGWQGLLPVRSLRGREFYVHSTCDIVKDEQDRPQFVFNIMYDVTEDLEREGALRRAREQAEAANLAKSEFLSRMSHELRTPLNAILGFAQLLETSRKDPLNEKQLSHVRHIYKGGMLLLELINEVLDLAKIEAGHLSLSIESIALGDVLEACLPLAETLARRQAITIKAPDTAPDTDTDTDTKRPLPRVRADFTRLKQSLLNLLSNAVKYNKEGGAVTVEVEISAADRVRISVSDTGQGIPQDRMEELFQPFQRLGAEATEIEGTGIGLALTRQLVEHMEGHIGVNSVPGEGSTFWIDLPLDTSDDTQQDTPETEAHGAEEESTTDPAASPPVRRLLYIEDNPANLMLMQEVIEEFEHLELVSAHTAELGLAQAQATRPDLVIMDINLPGMDGYQALKALQAEPTTCHIPVIALSADAMPKSIERGREAGFLAYLTKPVNVGALMDAIETALGEPEA